MKKEFYYLSKDQKTQIHAIEWLPKSNIIAILQLCHGMSEHINRYHEFAEFMTKHGVYVVGHDHLGHGKSVIDTQDLGYFHESDGNECLLGDIHDLRKITENKYKNVPYFMLGHSMGSFLIRQYISIYSGGLSGALIVGTGDQKSMAVKFGMIMCKLISISKSWRHRSSLINKLSIGSFEKFFGKAWLSRNPDNLKRYVNDPMCGFVFTLNAFYNMFLGISKMNKQEKSGNIPKILPIFFLAGQDDPVGNYGKGVKKVYNRYNKHGAQDVNIKLYPDDRHEILNELDKETVFLDILNWIKSKL